MHRPTLQKTTIGTVAGVILLVVATSPLWTILLVKRQAGRIVNESLHGLASSSLAGVNITDGFVELSTALATTDPAIREDNISRISVVSNQTDAQLKSFEATISDPETQAHYGELTKRRAVYRQTRAQVFELLRQGKPTDALKLYQGAGLAEFTAYKAAIDALVKHEATEAGRRGAEIIRLCNYLLILQGVLLVFFIIYAFFVPLVTFYERSVTQGDKLTDI
jgi:hypothetical protein